jgi:hypothetical protein
MEDNKLLAEFMGKEWHNSFFAGVSIISPSNITYKFDTDWNWLMQVVEKIESIEDNRFLFQTSARQGFYAEIRERFSYETKIEDAYGKTRIEAVYNACVEFVKWYNEQNKI